MSVPILEVVDLTAAYGRIEVLRGVNLSVPKGAVMALLGPNGAGKSTLVQCIAGAKEQIDGLKTQFTEGAAAAKAMWARLLVLTEGTYAHTLLVREDLPGLADVLTDLAAAEDQIHDRLTAAALPA